MVNSALRRCVQIRNSDHERHGIERGFIEADAQVEGLGFFGQGVHDQATWLERCAAASQVSGASRTFVICEDSKVVGYYALASSVMLRSAGGIRRFSVSRRVLVVLAVVMALSFPLPSSYP